MQVHQKWQDPGSADTGHDDSLRRHRIEIHHYLQVCGASPEEADDLTQETFLVWLRKQPQFTSDGAERQFLRRTARYLLLTLRRQSRRRSNSDLEHWLHTVETVWADRCEDSYAEWLEALRNCTAQLVGRAAQAVTLFYGQGMSRAAVARRMGMKETGLKTLLQRVRTRLRNCIRRITP